MKQKREGFTLLEMCMSLILFTIMLEGLWGFFTNIYVDYIQFMLQTALNSEASTIEDYISEYIRSADKIKITTEDGIIEVVGSPNNVEVHKAHLKKIEGIIKTPKADGSGFYEKKSDVVRSLDEKGNEVYKLTYSVNGSGTSNLISDEIESIKVTSKKASNLVIFECRLQKAGETNERLKVSRKFTESIANKEAYVR